MFHDTSSLSHVAFDSDGLFGIDGLTGFISVALRCNKFKYNIKVMKKLNKKQVKMYSSFTYSGYFLF